MCGEACPADGWETVSAIVGSWSDRSHYIVSNSGTVLLKKLCDSFVICNSISQDFSGIDCSGVVIATFLRIVLFSFPAQFLQIAVELIVHGSLCQRSCASVDRNVMAASRLLGAVSACIIFLFFVAGHRKSYWYLHQGCDNDFSRDFLKFGAGDFSFKNSF